MDEIIVIGAGAAGLTAARQLAAKGLPVTILEARERVGGRIHTVESATRNFPIELGAEFVHGRKNEVWEFLSAAGLPTHEVPDRHWRFAENHLSEMVDFWERLGEVMKTIDLSQPDHDVLSWLAASSQVPNSERQMALDYVEGFHAAPAERMSLQALARANQAAERDEGEHSFRVRPGYSKLIEWLKLEAMAQHAHLHVNTIVKKIRWEHGWAEVEAQTPGGIRLLQAARVLITVPLGVLKGDHPGIVFEPALVEKEEAINGLEMGQVVKLVLQFRERFWPVENFGFIHSDDEWLPTWWADERGPVLTGWTGGPRAEWLSLEDEASILAEAFRALSRIFKVDQERIAELLVSSWWHDWKHDQFAHGAYSYTPVGSLELPNRLAEPIAETLFFAGEATDAGGEQGTVHAAIASGKRAAKEICLSLNRGHVSGHLVRC